MGYIWGVLVRQRAKNMKINTKVGDLEYQKVNGRWIKISKRRPKQKNKKINAQLKAWIKKKV